MSERNPRFGPKDRDPPFGFTGGLSATPRIGGPGSHAGKVLKDLRFILSECEKNNTLHALPQVAIYFTEAELRAIVAALEMP